MGKSAVAVLVEEEEVLPLGFHQAQKMPRAVVPVGDDPRWRIALASKTFGTRDPKTGKGDDEADDTER